MARFTAAFMCLLAITTCVMAESLKDHFHELSIIKKEAIEVATAIRNIPVSSPQSKVQLASMAADFKTFLSYAVYSLNNVMQNTANLSEQRPFSDVARILSSRAFHIQKSIPEDAEHIKKELAKNIEEIHHHTTEFEQVFKFLTFSQFVSNQYEKANDFEIFALYKLKVQSEMFEKPNKQLESEIDKAVLQFTEVFNSITTHDKEFEDEMRDILQIAAVLIERDVYKLQNWVEVNPSKTADIDTVDDATKILIQMFDKVSNAIVGDLNAAQLKTELISIYDDVHKVAKKLTSIEYSENTGGQEFIRSTIFDGIAFGKVYAENIKNLLNKA